MSDQPPAGYHVTFFPGEPDERRELACVSCYEQNGWHIWERTPIAYEGAENMAIRCDSCHRLFASDYLQRQLDTAGRLLRDCHQFLAFGGMGTIGWPSSQEWREVQELKKQTEPYYYRYVEHGRKRR